MRMFAAVLTLFALALPGRAETLNGGERNRAVSELHATRKLFLDAIAGLTEAQWTYKPAPDRWSIAECAEHIALTEDVYFKTITERVMKSPVTPEIRAEMKTTDEEIIPGMADRSSKRQAGAEISPQGQPVSAAAIADKFKASRDRLINYTKTTQDDLRNHFRPHRAFGPIDGYQWILLACGHIQRHVAQINEVKADPGYPKR